MELKQVFMSENIKSGRTIITAESQLNSKSSVARVEIVEQMVSN